MANRFTILSLMTIILFLGLGLAAIRTGSFLCLQLVYTVTVVVLLLSVLTAKYLREAFCVGFAIFGWGYFLIAIGPWTFWVPVWEQPGRVTVQYQQANLLVLSNYPLDFLASYQPINAVFVPVGGIRVTVDSRKVATGIGHVVCVWLFGLAGGLIATYLSSRQWPHSIGPRGP